MSSKSVPVETGLGDSFTIEVEGDVVSVHSNGGESEAMSQEEEEQREREHGLVIKTGPRGRREKVLSAAADMSFRSNSNMGSQLDPDDPNYQDQARARLIVDMWYPQETNPTLADLVRSLESQTSEVWAPGSFVEFLGSDMRWRVGMVKRVVQQAPESWDWADAANQGKEPEWELFFNVGKATLLSEASIRAPEEAVRALFGARPLLWQQYALLRAEKHLRFQQDHERDFAELDLQQYADELLDEWLDDERNADFRELFDSKSPLLQQFVKDFLLSPFVQMDNLVEDEGEWDFKGGDWSIYTYMGILGSGSVFSLFVFAVQFIIPCILLLNALESSPRFDANFDADDFHLRTSWSEFCTGKGSGLGKAMNLAVISVYIGTVVPARMVQFYRTAGDAASTYSRLNSLREIVWDQRDDSLFQAIGFKLDRYMQSAYVAFLYVVLLFILFNTEEVLDVILNALAADFVHAIDESIAQSSWYDPGERWLKAGAIELVIQANLRLRVMSTPSLFMSSFDISAADYGKVMGGTRNVVPNAAAARRDENDAQFKTKEDGIFFMAAAFARSVGNDDAWKQFKKRLTPFSLVDMIGNSLGISQKGAFHRHVKYRVWSRWEHLLFLPPVPDTNVADLERVRLPRYRFEQKSYQFGRDVVSVLLGQRLLKDVKGTIEQGLPERLPFILCDSIVQILAYLTMLLFPLFVASGLALVPACY